MIRLCSMSWHFIHAICVRESKSKRFPLLLHISLCVIFSSFFTKLNILYFIRIYDCKQTIEQINELKWNLNQMSFEAIREWDVLVHHSQYIDSNIKESVSEWKPHGNVMSCKGFAFLWTISMEKPHWPVQKSPWDAWNSFVHSANQTITMKQSNRSRSMKREYGAHKMVLWPKLSTHLSAR